MRMTPPRLGWAAPLGGRRLRGDEAPEERDEEEAGEEQTGPGEGGAATRGLGLDQDRRVLGRLVAEVQSGTRR